MKTKTIICLLLLGLSAYSITGCGIRAQHLRSQPLTTMDTVAASAQTDAGFLLYALDDLRGSKYVDHYPTSFIPLINLLHIGVQHKYPETAGILRGQQGMKPFCSVGALDSSFPYLLADMMRSMKLSNKVVPIEEANVKANLSEYDYVVKGKLNKSELETHVNILPLGILSLIGAPAAFHNFTLDYEIQLFKADDMSRPLFANTYHRELSMTEGLYYGQSARFDLFIQALEVTLPEVVLDIAGKVKK